MSVFHFAENILLTWIDPNSRDYYEHINDKQPEEKASINALYTKLHKSWSTVRTLYLPIEIPLPESTNNELPTLVLPSYLQAD